MNLFIQSARNPKWPAYLSEVYKALGVKGMKLPDRGVDTTEVQGIIIWVEPKDRVLRSVVGKRYFHRVLTKCPKCYKIVPVGRLWQHATVHKSPKTLEDL